jgi:hypothetical protein
MNIAFFVRHFTERGTEVAIYDYAKQNEEVLNNKSFIICFNQNKQAHLGWPQERASYDKFQSRFQIIEIDHIHDMKYIIDKYNISFFHTLVHGGPDIYEFGNKDIWGNCKTIKHCVFDTTCKEADFNISISDELNRKNNTTIPVIPHIVDLPNHDQNLRNELRIPLDAIVFGRYGGKTEFNIAAAHAAIIKHVNANDNVYFLFMNTDRFYRHPRIIHLDRNIDLDFKVAFINTCDAMIHARKGGETFGLAIAEFSSKNKPIITCPCGDSEHIKILGDKALKYTSKAELLDIFKNIKSILQSSDDWNCYKYYTPQNIMSLFNKLIFRP